MTRSLRHRGPDDQGFYLEGALGLGIRRLSIIDLDGGHQPILNELARVCVVFNGEIYNFQELRKELESLEHSFKTRTDTEAIVHAYEQWGLEALSHLQGMFGLAIWDADQQQLVLARDPFGIKPLYYWDNGQALVFGSELRAILCHADYERKVDLEALDNFLTFQYVPSPRTAFSNIRKLQPGHALICTKKGICLHRYHKVLPTSLARVPETELVDELRERIFRAIKRQMVADVPIGAMLSGGMDSSTIATIMTKLTGGPIETFTVGFEGDFQFNELEQARYVARRINSHHHEIVISSREFLEFMPRSIWHLEEPIATASTLAFYRLCELAQQYVKVVLTGQGADEPFAGYPRYIGEYYGKYYRHLPEALHLRVITPLIEHLPRNERIKRAVRSLHVQDPLSRLIAIYSVIDQPLKRRLYRDDLFQHANSNIDAFKLWYNDVAQQEDLNKILYIDARSSLADNLLLYADKISMAVSLEARVPFLDLELMQFVESLPPYAKIRGYKQKAILKEAVSCWLPQEVIHRKKIGFTTPVDQWFRRDLQAEVENRLLSRGSACREYFHLDTIQQMLRDHRSGRHDYKRALFALLTFEIWHEQFIKPSRWSVPFQLEERTYATPNKGLHSLEQPHRT